MPRLEVVVNKNASIVARSNWGVIFYGNKDCKPGSGAAAYSDDQERDQQCVLIDSFSSGAPKSFSWQPPEISKTLKLVETTDCSGYDGWWEPNGGCHNMKPNQYKTWKIYRIGGN